MKKYAEHNKIAVWRKFRSGDEQVKSYPNGLNYLNGNMLVQSTITEPLHSYVRNYKRFGVEFSLFVWTIQKDSVEVFNRLDEIAKKIKKSQIVDSLSNGFKYLESEL